MRTVKEAVREVWESELQGTGSVIFYPVESSLSLKDS